MSTSYGVAALLGMLAMILLIAQGAGTLSEKQHLSSAADMVALSAGYAHLEGGEEACQVAGVLAEANGVRLTGCAVEGEEVEVSVGPGRNRSVRTGLFAPGPVTARAGPAD